jgi:hypothetical protein
VLAIAAGCCCLRAARRATGNVCRGWFAIALACGVWSVSDLLRRLGSDLVQGNRTGRPGSEQDTTALLLGEGSPLAPDPVGSPNGRATSPA